MSAMTSTDLQESLGREVLRKLRLATEAETNEDREIICSEVFHDIIGTVDDTARSVLGLPASCFFYEVLSAYYVKVWDAAEALLYTCRRLWSQPYIAPVYTLLLHRWLMVSSDAGGASERKKHINVLVTGARQLFEVDADAGTAQFAVLFNDLLASVLQQDDGHGVGIPEAAKAELLKLLAGYFPYYVPSVDLLERLSALPPLGDRARAHPAPVQDYVVTEVAGTLRSLRSEAGLLRYLSALQPLCAQSGRWREHVSVVPLMRLQSELYNLTVPGGPRYYPSKVRREAIAALDSAFPTGSKSRMLVSLVFRLMHPSDLPMMLWLWVASWARELCTLLASAVGKASRAVHALLNLALLGLLHARRSNAVRRA